MVTARFAGLAESRAVYRGAEGCLVEVGAPPPPPAALPPAGPSLLPEIAGPEPVETTDPAIKAALDAAFTETDGAPQRATKAMVIVHDGRVIAERYAPGYGVDTPMIGWSVTKSVTNALLGILVRQGKLDMTAPAPVAAWADPKDPRHAITPDNLLRMNSGLDVGQSLTASARDAFDPSAQMVFEERDMAGYAERFPLKFAPGARLDLHQRQHAAAVAHHPRQDRRHGAGRARLRPPRAVRQARHAARHPGVRRRRHADRLEPHAAPAARLGEVRPALPQ